MAVTAIRLNHFISKISIHGLYSQTTPLTTMLDNLFRIKEKFCFGFKIFSCHFVVKSVVFEIQKYALLNYCKSEIANITEYSYISVLLYKLYLFFSRDRSRDGYYSDRNELIRERERERGYLSDHNSSRFVYIL